MSNALFKDRPFLLKTVDGLIKTEVILSWKN